MARTFVEGGGPDAMPAPRGRRAEARQFLTFILTGGVAALCNLVARALLSHTFGYGTAVAIAYVVGLLVAFVLAKHFVFSSNRRRWHAELTRFAGVNCISFGQVWLVSVGLGRVALPRLGWSWHPQLCAHLVGVASPIATSYFAHKHFTFGKSQAEPNAAGSADIDGTHGAATSVEAGS